MTEALTGRTAIVTGGGWNVGRAVAIAFAGAGARVVVASRNADNLAATVRLVNEAGGEASSAPTDVTDLRQVEALVQFAADRYGPVDVFAAIAGGGCVYEPIDSMDPEAWDRIYRLNATSAFYAARAVLPTYRAANRGTLLLCSGGGGYYPVLGKNMAAYACAKAAVCRLADQLTAELWETGIRVNCLDPGLCWSPDALAEVERIERETGVPDPLRGRNRSPEAAGELATWLASDASAPLRGRLVSVYDTWWRDPARVAEVHASLVLNRLRRCEI